MGRGGSENYLYHEDRQLFLDATDIALRLYRLTGKKELLEEAETLYKKLPHLDEKKKNGDYKREAKTLSKWNLL
jgi:hypothetical protein